MPKFNVYLLTTAASWLNVEAPSAEKAEADTLLEGSIVGRALQSTEEPYRVVVEEVDDEDELEEADKAEVENDAVQVGA